MINEDNSHRFAGIPQDTCGKIFEPFVQVDSSYARRFGGTGTFFLVFIISSSLSSF